jgi:predicted membrane protein
MAETDKNQPGRDFGDRMRREIHDEIHDRVHDRFQEKMDRSRARWEEKMARRQQRWHNRMTYRRSNPFGGLLAGVILAGVGVLLLLQNLGIVFVDDLWDYWPVILIVVGISRAATAWDFGGRVWGAIVTFVGAVFLVRNLGLIHGSVWNFFWPVILIAVGLGLLMRALERNNAWDLWGHKPEDPVGSGISSSGPAPNPGTGGVGPNLRNSFKEDHVFGGGKRRVDSPDFEGGEANVIFGGLELDLRNADTKKDEVFIEANAIFGGIEIRVPETWDVTVRGTGIFGGYGDETHRIPPGDTKRPHLIVTGGAIFGGVNVKN